MNLMNIEVEMPPAEQLALISTLRRILRDERLPISPSGRKALFKVKQAAIHAVEVKNAYQEVAS